MYKILYTALSIFWVFDIINLPFMEMFDTTYPVNALAWFLIWAVVPGTETIIKHTRNED